MPERRRTFLAIAVLVVAMTGLAGHAQTPIAVGNAPYIPLLRAWWTEGTAAGNAGDFYENRDGGHSALALGEFPQMTRWPTNSVADGNDTGWGACRVVRSGVVIGNSSTAGAPPTGSSLGRRLYTFPGVFPILYQQYRSNNLYVYPEHADHDPGNGGASGWGDLYPANSPYFLNSQGSSTTDLPFVRAAVASLAALRPDSKRLLVENGLLMPALQMLLRSTATHLTRPEDYFTGRAHPSAFDPNTVDALRMVERAHQIEPDSLPPLAQIKIVTEDPPAFVRGVHLFDVNGVEPLGDTPCSVARVWRSLDRTRRLVVSAESSLDANERPLTYRWVVLRGDPSRITFRPLNARRSVVEIRFEWGGRQPLEPDPTLASSRQEIGLFVSNGVWWSAPAFLGWYASDQELRTYGPDGRLLDVGYTGGGVSVEIEQLTPFFDWLQGNPQNPGVQLCLDAARSPSTAALTSNLRTAAAGVPPAADPGLSSTNPAPSETLAEQLFRLEPAIREAEALKASTLAASGLAITARNDAAAALSRAEAEARANGTDPNSPAIQNLRLEYEKKAAAALTAIASYNAADAAAAVTTDLPRRLVVRLFQGLAERPDFTRTYADPLNRLWQSTSLSLRNFINAAKNRLVGFGMVPTGSEWTFGSATGRAEWTAFEKNLVSEFQAKLLAQIVRPEGVIVRFVSHYIDPALFVPKDFRDVYQHDTAGRIVGWRRYRPGSVEDFTADGHLVLDRDRLGRPHKAAGVRYFVPRPVTSTATTAAFLQSTTNSNRYTYQYSGDGDLRGRAFESR